MPGYESAGPGSIPAPAVGVQPTHVFIHSLGVVGLWASW